MRKYILFFYKIFFVLYFIIITISTIFSQSFEGTIIFKKITFSDTAYYKYYVKDNYVRFDEYNKCFYPNNYLLFDLKNRTITAISPQHKLYMNVPIVPYVEPDSKDFQVIKSKNNKMLQGYTCYQWRVKNRKQNTEITYWVAFDNFNFFKDFLILWNRAEKHSIYFLQIPDSKGYFPILSVERTLLREEKMRLEVVDIEKKKLDSSLFIIPEGFKPYSE